MSKKGIFTNVKIDLFFRIKVQYIVTWIPIRIRQLNLIRIRICIPATYLNEILDVPIQTYV
jgi:hypothetical protein